MIDFRPDSTGRLVGYLQRLMLSKEIQLEPAFASMASLALIEALMECDVSAQIDADRYERTAQRAAYRNGYRETHWQSQGFSLRLRVPKLRRGSYNPHFLQNPRLAQVLESALLPLLIDGQSAPSLASLLRQLGLPDVSDAVLHAAEQEWYSRLERALAALRRYQHIDTEALDTPAEYEGQRVWIAVGESPSGERILMQVLLAPAHAQGIADRMSRLLDSPRVLRLLQPTQNLWPSSEILAGLLAA